MVCFQAPHGQGHLAGSRWCGGAGRGRDKRHPDPARSLLLRAGPSRPPRSRQGALWARGPLSARALPEPSRSRETLPGIGEPGRANPGCGRGRTPRRPRLFPRPASRPAPQDYIPQHAPRRCRPARLPRSARRKVSRGAAGAGLGPGPSPPSPAGPEAAAMGGGR